ncbi:MAG TPA: YfiR family protein [bacterium]|nr:YfiR family protein [bacterium]
MTRKSLILIFLLAFLTGPLGLRAESSRAVDPYELEAAYLVHFLEFVGWPESAFADPKSPYVIGVLGEDPFGEKLSRLTSGRLFNGRTVIIKKFGGYDPEEGDDLRACHVLFVAGSEKDRLPIILKILRRAPVLTVSEIEKFPLYGGILAFDQEGKKIRLYVNPKAAKGAQLQFSARLLQVCRTYGDD